MPALRPFSAIQNLQRGKEAVMYFEPSKKNYYRFPSSNSVHEMDMRFYFPEKPYANGENIRMMSKEDSDSRHSDNSEDRHKPI